MQTVQAASTFFAVSLEILEAGKILPCDIWLRHDGTDPILYRAKDLAFEPEHVRRLAESGVESVLISFEDARAWTDYLGQRLRHEARDESKPLSGRIEMLLRTSRATMNDIYRDPKAPVVKEQVSHLADSITKIMQQPDALVTSIRMMEHDYYTYTHSLHVAFYGVSLAHAAGLHDTSYISSIGRGCLMHDIGKVGLSHALLNKRGRLTKEEFDQIKTHPMRGARMLDEAHWGDPIARDIVLCHHEDLNGQGYPHGRHDDLISVACRIASISDAFDAMTTDRSYARAMSANDALTILRTRRVDAYDQSLIKVFITMLLDPSEKR